MLFSFAIVDAFVGELEGRVLRGNPAAVVLMEKEKPDEWLQNVAAEFNLSETAFLWKKDDSNLDLRWFTPKSEVNLCGHATLAAAHLLNEKGANFPLHFHTKSGVLFAYFNSQDSEYCLHFPRVETRVCPIHPQLTAILGLSNLRQPVALLRAGEDWLLKIAPGNLTRLNPDFSRLGALLAGQNLRGLIVTEKAPAGAPYDFASRFFAPHLGIEEDPVTGSAHCALAPFWAGEKTEVVGFQNSPRGGLVRCIVRESKVALSGAARIFARGHLDF